MGGGGRGGVPRRTPLSTGAQAMIVREFDGEEDGAATADDENLSLMDGRMDEGAEGDEDEGGCL